jgi:hypothetical protein
MTVFPARQICQCELQVAGTPAVTGDLPAEGSAALITGHNGRKSVPVTLLTKHAALMLLRGGICGGVTGR